MNLRRIKIMLVAACFAVPVALGASRNVVLESLVRMLGVELVTAQPVEGKQCRGSLCRMVYQLDLANRGDGFAMGYYSVFGESVVSYQKPPEVWTKSALNVNWFNFAVNAIPPAPQGKTSTVWVECFNHLRDTKLGFETNVVFYGREKSIKAVAFIYDLFSVHLYLLLAIGSMLAGMLFSLARTMERRVLDFGAVIEGGIIAVTLVGYSHIFDATLMEIGFSTRLIQVFPRAFLGGLILHFFLHEEKLATRRFWIGLYALLVFPGGLSFSVGSTLVHLGLSYRWVTAGITVLMCLRILRGQNPLLLSPFCLLMIVDVLAIHDLVPLHSGLYVSPLGISGLFVAKYSEELMMIINRNMIFLRSLQLKARLDAAKVRHFKNELDWEGFLKESLYALRDVTTSSRIAIFFKHGGSPIVLSLRGKDIFPIADGQIPPLFARVLQTRNEYWWIEGEEMQRLLAPRALDRRAQYRSDYAIIVPIVIGEEVYAIISLTDFSGASSLKTNSHEKQYIEAMTRDYMALIAAELIVRHERDHRTSELSANRLMESFLTKVSLSVDRESVVNAFLDALAEHWNFKILFLDFDTELQSLRMVTSRHLTEGMVSRWSNIPFRAGPENHISPFAVAVNEQRVVYIDDMSHFYGVLERESVEALVATETKSFLVLPVVLNGRLMGMVTILDGGKSDLVGREFERIAAMSVQYLGFKLAECERTNLFERQSQLLGNFVGDDLARNLVEADSDALPIGRIEKGVLIVQDLRGSTSASKKALGPQDYARSLYGFYCGADQVGEEINCQLEITVGDSLVYVVEDQVGKPRLSVQAIEAITRRTQQIAFDTMGVNRILSIFHYGEVFKGIFTPKRRLRWDIAGADFNDLFKMESAAKGVAGGVVAMSDEFVLAMGPAFLAAISQVSQEKIVVKDTQKKLLVFNQAQFDEFLRLMETATVTAGSTLVA